MIRESELGRIIFGCGNFGGLGSSREADAHGWTLPAAALRFILDTPGVDSLIIAPRSLDQFAAYGIGA
jgi:hypothetical protein